MSACPNRPEWAAPVPALTSEGFCFHCSKVEGRWVPCEAVSRLAEVAREKRALSQLGKSPGDPPPSSADPQEGQR